MTTIADELNEDPITRGKFFMELSKCRCEGRCVRCDGHLRHPKATEAKNQRSCKFHY